MGKSRSSTRDDFDKIKDAFNILKSENRKLRKENAQLRKELNRTITSEFERSVDLEDDELEVESAPKKIHKKYCSRCKAEEIVEIEAGKYLIRLCNSCGFKRRAEIK